MCYYLYWSFSSFLPLAFLPVVPSLLFTLFPSSCAFSFTCSIHNIFNPITPEWTWSNPLLNCEPWGQLLPLACLLLYQKYSLLHDGRCQCRGPQMGWRNRRPCSGLSSATWSCWILSDIFNVFSLWPQEEETMSYYHEMGCLASPLHGNSSLHIRYPTVNSGLLNSMPRPAPPHERICWVPWRLWDMAARKSEEREPASHYTAVTLHTMPLLASLIYWERVTILCSWPPVGSAQRVTAMVFERQGGNQNFVLNCLPHWYPRRSSFQFPFP